MLKLIQPDEDIILQKTVQEMENGSFSSPIYVFGRNKRAKKLCELFPVIAVIDDYTQHNTAYDLPIIRSDQIPHNAFVLSSNVGRPFTVKKLLSKNNILNIDYFSLYRYSNFQLESPYFWKTDFFKTDFSFNKKKYITIFKLLADAESKKIFRDILQLRLYNDISVMAEYRDQQTKQYFEPFIQFKDDDVFVDVGGYDGQTSHRFIQHCIQYKWIYFFEPNCKNMLLAREELKKFKKIEFIEKIAANEKRSFFLQENGPDSTISEEDGAPVYSISLDEACQRYIPTYIKIDVEGFENQVLAGANEIIKKYQPTLAVSVYHNYDDFWKIPEAILSLRSDYSLFLRHYLEGPSETVMYFIPS